MPTKTIVLGESYTKKKTITFSKVVNKNGTLSNASTKPSNFKYIELIRPGEGLYDIMFAYHDPAKREDGVLYLGFWNDGVV